MPIIQESIDISASPLAVDEVLCDIDAAPLWTSGLDRFELVEGIAGEPGCVGHAHYVEGSRHYVVEDRLVDVVHGERYKSKIDGGGMKATVETRLDEIPSGTRVTIRWSGTGTTPFSNLILTLLRYQVVRRTREDMRKLRELVERRSWQDQEDTVR